MKQWKCAFVFMLLIISTVFSQDANYRQRVAIITSLSGDVSFKTTQSTVASKAWVGLDLLPNDTLFIGTDGHVRLLFMDSNLVRLNGNTELIVGRSTRESKIVKGNGLPHSLSSSDYIAACDSRVNVATLSSQYRKSLASPTRELEFEPSILTILPAKSVYNVKPVFMWFDPSPRRDTKHDQEYTLIIFQSQRKSPSSGDFILKEIIRRKVLGKPQTFITYELQDRLSYGNVYEWDVFIPGKEPENIENFHPYGSFRITDSSKADEVMKMIKCCTSRRENNTVEQTEYHLLVGSFLKGQKLFSEAALEYEKAGELLTNAYPFEELVMLYDRCGEQANYKKSKTFEILNTFSTK